MTLTSFYLSSKNTDSCTEISDCEIMKNSIGEIRIITHYFDDELIWSAYVASLPSFYIVGYVLGMNDKKIMSIKNFLEIDQYNSKTYPNSYPKYWRIMSP